MGSGGLRDRSRIHAWIGELGVLGLVVLGLAVASVRADPVEEGLEANRRGDFAEAYCLWRPLAEAGDAQAQYLIGWLYANGQGLRVSRRTAARWWRLAAEQGHAEARYALGRTYLRGAKGVSKNRAEALRWMLAAARGGVDDARLLLFHMAGEGDPEALALVGEALRGEDWQALGVVRILRADQVNLRKGPSTGDEVVTRLPRGRSLVELTRMRHWVQVGVVGSGDVGWVYGKFVDAGD